MATRKKKAIDELVAELGLDPDVGAGEYDYDASKRELRKATQPAPASRKLGARKVPREHAGAALSWAFDEGPKTGVMPGARWVVVFGEEIVLAGAVQNRDLRDGRILLALDPHCSDHVARWIDASGPREALLLRAEHGDAAADAATLRVHRSVMPMPGDPVVLSFVHP
jgi:hypothetical protein